MDDSGVFRFLANEASSGQRTALVTVTRVDGSSMRNPGAHLGVAETGAWRGSLSGGCIEAAVVAEALAALQAGTAREVRFGAGSPYIDIRLPCGGSLDVLINPIEDASLAGQAQAMFEARVPFTLAAPLAGRVIEVIPELAVWRTKRENRRFSVAHLPPLAITIVGHGGAVEALHGLASAAGAVVRVLTPDGAIVERLGPQGVSVQRLRTPDQDVDFNADMWTAIAFLFHDHDWESALIAGALASPAFYVGAMGSCLAQARRAAALAGLGISAAAISRLHAPIGLIASSRDPQVLALSVLAEIVRDHGCAIDRPDITTPAGMTRNSA